jgi:hypothetical protein
MEEAATPLPSEETTPPVTNIYFGAIRVARAVATIAAPDFSYLSGELSGSLPWDNVHTIMGMSRRSVNSNSLRVRIEIFSSFCLSTKPFFTSGVPIVRRAGGGPWELLLLAIHKGPRGNPPGGRAI